MAEVNYKKDFCEKYFDKGTWDLDVLNQVDVLLKDKKQNILLYIESKFTITNETSHRKALAQVILTNKKQTAILNRVALIYKDEHNNDILELIDCSENSVMYNNDINWNKEKPSNPTQDAIDRINDRIKNKIRHYENEEIKVAVEELKSEWMGMDFLEIPYQRKLYHEKLEAIKGNDEIYAYFLELLYENEDLQSELEYIVDFRRFGEKVEKKLDQSYAGVVLTTAHSSKGLEWPIVFNTITGYDNKYLHTGRNRNAEVEEKRRLLYVSMTRARDILYLTGRYVAYGQMGDYTYNQFLKELFEVAQGSYNPSNAQLESKAKKDAEKAMHAKGQMTQEEIADYEARVKNAKQMTITDFVQVPKVKKA